ncbi:MAG: glycosyltransferase [Helicobacter sp.]|nr:glycosyltransferase [Helicobacter sp.]
MESKPTIALVISSLKMGGAEKVASLLANNLIKNYQIVLFVWSKEGQFYSIDSKVKIYEIKTNLRGILGNLMRVFLLSKAFRKEKISLSISFIHKTNILNILSAKLARIPSIATEHSIFATLDKEWLWKFLRRLVYPLANCVTTLTKGDLANYNFLNNACVMPNPIECQDSHATYCELKKPYILSVGRLIESKGFDELIEAFRIFSEKNPQYFLYIAGDGILKEKLQGIANGLKVEFLGKVTKLSTLYKNAEFSTLASKFEGLSNVLIESIMQECPAISYNCPYGPSEIINKNSGILVEFHKDKNKRIESLANAFSKMAQNKECFKQSIKLESKIIKERFSIESALKQWEEKIIKLQNQFKFLR